MTIIISHDFNYHNEKDYRTNFNYLINLNLNSENISRK